MKFTVRLRSWWRSVSRRMHMEQDMDNELRFHVESYCEDLVRSGAPPEEAKRRAQLEFGSVEARKDECRDALGLRFVYELVADLRYAFRMLRQASGFTAVAVLSLALGIGANTAIFTLMETALWKALPVKNPQKLKLFSWASGSKTVMDSLWGNVSSTPGGGATSTSFSYAAFKAMQRQNTAFHAVFAFKPISGITAVVRGQAQLVTGELVSGNYYESLGLVPIIGRPLVPADDAKPGVGAVAVISDAFWSREFGRDPAAIGTKIELNQFPVIIVGVNPPSFHGMATGAHPDVFFPLSIQPLILPVGFAKNGNLLDDANTWWLLVMGRLDPGINDAKAQAALDIVLTQTVRETLPNKLNRAQPRLRLASGSRGLDELRSQFRKPLLVLMALVGLVLLIACANLANLLLSRATARQREISVRLALGAGRWRITRQLLTEGLLLAGIGGAAGVLAGYGLRNGIPRLLVNSWTPNPLEAQFDLPVLFLSIGITLFTGILFSLAPAWQSARVEINAALKDGVHATMSFPKLVTGKALVILQVCLSVLLLVGAGLFIRTLINLRNADLGFNPARVLLFTIDPPRTRYKGEQSVTLFGRIQEKIDAIPGVQSASLSEDALVANDTSTTSVSAKGSGSRPAKEQRAWINIVDSGFLHTMEIPILYGRSFNTHDRANSPRVAIVNQQFVQRFFPNTNPLGKIFGDGTDYQIVGVCGNAKYSNIRGAVPPTFYLPYTQSPELGAMTFEVKTAANQASVVEAIREAVRSVDKDLPVSGIRTQTEQIDATISNERAFAALSSGLGLLALVLAAIGIYGVMAYAVVRRTGEIGIRMALGAQSGQVLRMILRESLLLTAAGVVIGVIAAAGLTRYVETMLYRLNLYDPITIAGAVLVMLGVALFAAWWPARRASRLDPMAALRHE
jgi:Acidobacterial duplicated orphan permease